MMWMPLRSVRMKRLTFGFHRRVWCPKWTPLSSSWRMVTTAMAVLLFSTLGSAACGCVFRRTDRPASLVPGALPLTGRDRPSRPVGVHAARSRTFGPLRAVGTRIHLDERGVLPVYQPALLPTRLLPRRHPPLCVPTHAEAITN